MTKQLILIIISGVLISCSSRSIETGYILNFDSLIHAQVAMLSKSKVLLKKRVIINETEETRSLPSDSVQWAQELDIIKQLSIINKPIYRGVYNIEKNRKDPNSNLSVRIYSSNEPIPIPEIRLYFRDQSNTLRRIEASYIENNSLYKSKRNFIIEFEEMDGSIALSRLQVQGYQKMILGDSTTYAIISTIIY